MDTDTETDKFGPPSDDVSSIPPYQPNPFAKNDPGALGSGAGNPYKAPQADKAFNSNFNRGAIRPRSASIEEIWPIAWSLWKENIGLLTGTVAVIWLVSVVMAVFLNLVQTAMLQMGISDAVFLGISFLLNFFPMAVQAFLQIGQTRICLNLARRQPADFSMLFCGSDKFLALFGAWIVVYIMTIIGFCLLVVPGVIVALAMWPVLYVLADNQSSFADCFGITWSIGKQNLLTSFVLMFVCVGIALTGLLLCGIGLIPASGLIAMVMTIAYLKMSSQI